MSQKLFALFDKLYQPEKVKMYSIPAGMIAGGIYGGLDEHDFPTTLLKTSTGSIFGILSGFVFAEIYPIVIPIIMIGSATHIYNNATYKKSTLNITRKPMRKFSPPIQQDD